MERILEAQGEVTLIAATVADLDAEAVSVETLCRRLAAAQPDVWPPEHMGAETQAAFRARLAEDEAAIGWWSWYIVASGVLVGGIGYKGPPGPDGVVEIGYSVVPSRQRRGYATTAVQLLVARAFREPQVTAVVAETLPDLAASQRVLAKAGFLPVDGGSAPGVIRFQRPRL